MAANAACISKFSPHTISLSGLKVSRSTNPQLRSRALSSKCAGCGSALRPSSFLGKNWELHSVDKRSLQSGQTVQLRRDSIRAAGGGGGGREPWDFSRFLKTVLYFNEPPKLEEVSFVQVVHGLMFIELELQVMTKSAACERRLKCSVKKVES